MIASPCCDVSRLPHMLHELSCPDMPSLKPSETVNSIFFFPYVVFVGYFGHYDTEVTNLLSAYLQKENVVSIQPQTSLCVSCAVYILYRIPIVISLSFFREFYAIGTGNLS